MIRRKEDGGKEWMTGSSSKGTLGQNQTMILRWGCNAYTNIFLKRLSVLYDTESCLQTFGFCFGNGCRIDEARQPLSRKVPIASSKINPYRMVIVARLVILAVFLRYRLLNPVHDALGLWLTSVICEIWFAVSWILDQFPKWFPIDRETYLDRLSLR